MVNLSESERREWQTGRRSDSRGIAERPRRPL